MSKVADCPNCGEHNCVSDRTELNYCMWCGYSFKDKQEVNKIIIDSLSGQTSLFDINVLKQ